MGDMGEFWADVKEARKAERDQQEPKAMANAERRLKAAGFTIKPNDPWSYRVEMKGGRFFYYWPLNGWYQGAGKSGRGIKSLLKAYGPKILDVKPKP